MLYSIHACRRRTDNRKVIVCETNLEPTSSYLKLLKRNLIGRSLEFDEFTTLEVKKSFPNVFPLVSAPSYKLKSLDTGEYFKIVQTNEESNE